MIAAVEGVRSCLSPNEEVVHHPPFGYSDHLTGVKC